MEFRGSRAAAPKGPMAYTFTHMGSFLLLVRLSAHPPWLRFRPNGWDLSIKGLKPQPKKEKKNKQIQGCVHRPPVASRWVRAVEQDKADTRLPKTPAGGQAQSAEYLGRGSVAKDRKKK